MITVNWIVIIKQIYCDTVFSVINRIEFTAVSGNFFIDKIYIRCFSDSINIPAVSALIPPVLALLILDVIVIAYCRRGILRSILQHITITVSTVFCLVCFCQLFKFYIIGIIICCSIGNITAVQFHCCSVQILTHPVNIQRIIYIIDFPYNRKRRKTLCLKLGSGNLIPIGCLNISLALSGHVHNFFYLAVCIFW